MITSVIIFLHYAVSHASSTIIAIVTVNLLYLLALLINHEEANGVENYKKRVEQCGEVNYVNKLLEERLRRSSPEFDFSRHPVNLLLLSVIYHRLCQHAILVKFD